MLVAILPEPHGIHVCPVIIHGTVRDSVRLPVMVIHAIKLVGSDYKNIYRLKVGFVPAIIKAEMIELYLPGTVCGKQMSIN